MRDAHCKAAALKMLHMSQSLSLDGEQNRITSKFRDGPQQFHSILRRRLDFEAENRQKGPLYRL